MTESLNDNNPTGDKLAVFQCDDQTLVSDAEGDDDFFICRKCSKVFNNLPEYLEHKVKDENYRIAQMRSKVDRRMVLPQLVQRQKRKKGTKVDEAKRKDQAVAFKKLTPTESLQHMPNMVGDDISSDRTSENGRDISEKNQKVVSVHNIQEQASGQEDKLKQFRVSRLPIPAQTNVQDNTYMCNICERKFRREAALRWHIKYDHKKKDDGEDSESSDDELRTEAVAEADEDFKIENEKEELDDHYIDDNVEENTPHEIHVIIEQPQSIQASQGTEQPQDIKAAGTVPKSVKQRMNKLTRESKGGEADRPYTCDVCGRSFKELTVLKAHAVVHSDERKFTCTVQDCPYGFKTKGGLVRHMRRHTGERPYACERCGRAFSESGALTRHMKARRNCSLTPDSAYPRYMKNWTYHPNIPAVVDPSKRDAQQGRNTLRRPGHMMDMSEDEAGEVHFLITDAADPDVVTAEIISPRVADLEVVSPHVVSTDIIVPQVVDGPTPALEIKLEKEDMVEGEEWNSGVAEVQATSEMMTVAKTEEVGEVVTCVDAVPVTHRHVVTSSQQSSSAHPEGQPLHLESSAQDQGNVKDDVDLLELKNSAEVESLASTQCHVCRKDFEAEEGLEIHLRSHLADQPSRCGLCHFLAQDREELRQHILSMHYDSLNNIEASVLSMEEVGGNKNESMHDRKAALRDALVAVKQLYSLKKNKVTSEVEKPSPSTSGSLQCMVCNRFFRGSSYLRQHMRTHTGDRPHQCHLCSRSFTSRDILKKHMYVHKEHRDFKCGECGKLFKRLAHVQQHLRIHSQERSFRCTVCDKLFKTQNSLKVHLRTHSGVNPYKCHVCSRHFRERGSLQRHMRLHTGEKPYKCPLCNRAFAEQGTLSRHLKAKMPCSSTRNTGSLESSEASSSTVLAQFSTMVADTQQYILPEVDSGQQYILPAVQDQEMGEDYVVLHTATEGTEEVVENIEVITEEGMAALRKADAEMKGDQARETETLQIFDSSTGESLIIVAEKSIVDLMRDQQLSLESGEGGSSLQKIKDILFAAGESATTSVAPGEYSAALEHEELPSLAEEGQIVHDSGSEEITLPANQEESSAPVNLEATSTVTSPAEEKT